MTVQLPTLIDRFEGPWFVYSNFYGPVKVKLFVARVGLGGQTLVWGGMTHYAVPGTTYTEEVYDSTEHAYQAAKFLDPEIRARFRYEGLKPGQAKRMAANMKSRVRKDWFQVNIPIMRDLLQQKFTYSILKRKLMASFSAELVEGNTWHDNFWGNCVCGERPECEAPGQNWLGKLLMELRRSFIV
jgi:ribA/ribD-fused uncharacterized protein